MNEAEIKDFYKNKKNRIFGNVEFIGELLLNKVLSR